MSTAPRYVPHYTTQDYAQWEGDWELIDGVPIAMTPSPFGPHERVVSRLARIIGAQIEAHDCSCEVYTNLDWIVSDDTVVRPDVMVVCGHQPAQHLERSPVVAVEVLSDSTRTRDRTAKRDLYREHDVADYLVIDPEQRTLEHFTPAADDGTMFSELSVLQLDLEDGCRIEIEIARLFDA